MENKPNKNRKFYELPQEHLNNEKFSKSTMKSEELCEYIRKNVIGHEYIFHGPFGPRKGKNTISKNKYFLLPASIIAILHLERNGLLSKKNIFINEKQVYIVFQNFFQLPFWGGWGRQWLNSNYTKIWM